MLLIGLGWKIILVGFSWRTWLGVAIVGTLYFSVSIATLSCDPLASSCIGLNLGTYVVQSLTMLGVLVSINFSVTTLRGVMGDYPSWVDETALTVHNVYSYVWMRCAVLAYLLAPTVFFIVQLTHLSWR